MLEIPEGFNGFSTNGELVGKWVTEKSGGYYVKGFTAIGIIRNGKLAVGVMYSDFTGQGGSILMHSRCDNPKATSRWFYWMIFDYPFNQLGVKRITLVVNENNHRAIRLNTKLGFDRDTTIKGYFPDGDAIIFAMYREGCKWLKESRNEQTLVF